MKHLTEILYQNTPQGISPLGVKINWRYLRSDINENKEIETLEVSEAEYGASGLKGYYIIHKYTPISDSDNARIESIYFSHVSEKQTKYWLENCLPPKIFKKVFKKK